MPAKLVEQSSRLFCIEITPFVRSIIIPTSEWGAVQVTSGLPSVSTAKHNGDRRGGIGDRGREQSIGFLLLQKMRIY